MSGAPALATVAPDGPDFACAVPEDGYAWWYLDAISDDGEEALTVIAFVGSVFSPYYAWARGRGPTAAEAHVSINAALYRPRGRGRWCMTERDGRSLQRTEREFIVGPSGLRWDGATLTLELTERCAPFGDALRGTVRLHVSALSTTGLELDTAGRHHWQPIAPAARVEVAFSQPALHWQGTGYFDHNRGSEPLENGFRYWTWSRQHLHGGNGSPTTAITYDVVNRQGTQQAVALTIDGQGQLQAQEMPTPATRLATGLWGVQRTTRLPEAELQRALEDTPFYTRSLLRNPRGPAVAESLDLERFQTPWVQVLLPFRMPRWKGMPPRLSPSTA